MVFAQGTKQGSAELAEEEPAVHLPDPEASTVQLRLAVGEVSQPAAVISQKGIRSLP